MKRYLAQENVNTSSFVYNMGGGGVGERVPIRNFPLDKRGRSLENGGLERFLVLIRQTYWSFRVGMDPEEAESCKKDRKKILTN